jgi:3-carboxy-cis,cis-muconate cycloisomerase
MPHKRNPVSSTIILAAHDAAQHFAGALTGGMAAAHERPAGAWHAEWHVLPTLFGLASGALREARALAEGITVDTDRMRANLGLTRGLLFADAAAARLTPSLGRQAAHDAVEHAAAEVRGSNKSLLEILARDFPATPGIETAFDFFGAVQAASPWIDRALAFAAGVADKVEDGFFRRPA